MATGDLDAVNWRRAWGASLRASSRTGARRAEGLGAAFMLCGLFGIAAGILFFIASRIYPEDLQKVKCETILAE